MRARAALVLALLVAGVTAAGATALAQDVEQRPTPTSRARDAIAAAHSELLAWARAETRDSELRRDVLTLPPPPEPNEDLGTAHQTLGEALARYGELERRLERRRSELLFGASAPPEDPGLADRGPTVETYELPALPRAGPARITFPPGIQPARGAISTRFDDDESLVPLIEPNQLRNLVEIDQEDLGATVELDGGRLTIHASRRGHERARALLERARRWLVRPLSLDVRVYRLGRAELAEVLDLAGGPTLDAAAEERLARACRDGKATLLDEQTLLAADGRAALARSGTTHVYPSDFVVATDAQGAPVASATFTTRVDAGLSLELRPIVDEVGGRVVLALDGAFAKLVGPIARERLLGHDVGTPELALARAGTTVSLPLGRTTLAYGAFASDEGAAEVPLACVVAIRPALLDRAPPPAAPRGEPRDRPPPPEPLVSPSAETRVELDRLARLEPVVRAAVERIQEARELRWELVDARLALASFTDRYGPELGAFHGRWGSGWSIFEYDEGLDDPGGQSDRLYNTVRDATGGDKAWIEFGTLDLSGNFLLVRHTSAIVDQVRAEVAKAAARRSRAALLDVSVYRVTPALLATVDSSLTGVLGHDAVLSLERASAAGEGATFVGGAFVTLRERERSHVGAGVERSYVAGVQALPEGTQPQLGLLRTGLRVGARVHRTASGGAAVQVEVERARLTRWETFAVPGGEAKAPSLEMDSAAVHAELPPGGAQLLRRGIVGTGPDARVEVLVVRVR